ncbi:MAG: DUF1028 domain-containing protein [Planctomycetota bacterium]|nr:DUF1028 domain-containing protein [Planctomycetota bacterium]MDA1113463.1 DUF1028 domain-containing protein [Planctomycetota bacterium]
MVALNLRRPLAALLALCLLAGQTFATWSIVVVNRRTGEICVASATCIEDFNLRNALSIVSAEAGGGAAQAMVSSVAVRTLIHDLILQGVPPEEILIAVDEIDTIFQSRQFGIVDLAGRAVTFTGTSAFDHASGVTGEIGDLVYAIQGNILTGSPVITEAELALRNTPGDLGQRVMAAMEAAQAMGGDGRCSCSPQAPTSCGSPPSSFTKSAHIGFLITARPGDEPFCDAFGCGKGDLYMVINKAGLDANDPDPVFEMRIKFDQLRNDLDDRPDGNHSEVFAFNPVVAAGSALPVSFVLSLADVDGDVISHGGATVTMEHDPRSAGSSSLLQVTDHQDGTYTVEVQPGAEAGLDLLRFVVDDGIRPVTLWPPAQLLHRAPLEAPQLTGEAAPGLASLVALHAVHPQPSGLSAWILGSRGQGGEFLLAERADLQSDFVITTDVGIAHFGLASVQDFWMSADGLRLTLAALDTIGGTVQLYSTTRLSDVEDFPQPTLLTDLDSGMGEGGPWLSEHELDIWFHSSRDGQADIWHATRLNKEARWFPPVKVEALSTSAEERNPMLDSGDTRLILSRQSTTPAFALFAADRNLTGDFNPAHLLPGVFADSHQDLIAAGSSPNPSGVGQQLWRLSPNGSGQRDLTLSATSRQSLSVTPESISQSSGGNFTFQLDATPSQASANYTLFFGDTSGSTYLPGIGSAPILQQGFTQSLVNLYAQPELSEATGTLDASASATAVLTLPAGLNLPQQLLNRDLGVCFLVQGGVTPFLSERVVVRILP